MKFLAKVRNKKPLPLLLHIGPEYAIPTTDEKTFTYDFMSWSWMDKTLNRFRFKNRWYTPQVKEIEKNINNALQAGAVIIFAHCGLPYFASGISRCLEHSDLHVVRCYLEQNGKNQYPGKCYADVSALSTPFRAKYFDKVADLPPDYLIFGSDFPTPLFELYADEKEMRRDLKAIFAGHFERALVPQDNLLDVNYRQLRTAFPGHRMFTTFSKLFEN
jgi:predicted TIM-barrel fold metal-dependent hydrolase